MKFILALLAKHNYESKDYHHSTKEPPTANGFPLTLRKFNSIGKDKPEFVPKIIRCHGFLF